MRILVETLLAEESSIMIDEPEISHRPRFYFNQKIIRKTRIISPPLEKGDLGGFLNSYLNVPADPFSKRRELFSISSSIGYSGNWFCNGF